MVVFIAFALDWEPHAILLFLGIVYGGKDDGFHTVDYAS